MPTRNGKPKAPDYDRHHKRAKLLRMDADLWDFLEGRKRLLRVDVNSQIVALIRAERDAAQVRYARRPSSR